MELVCVNDVTGALKIIRLTRRTRKWKLGLVPKSRKPKRNAWIVIDIL